MKKTSFLNLSGLDKSHKPTAYNKIKIIKPIKKNKNKKIENPNIPVTNANKFGELDSSKNI